MNPLDRFTCEQAFRRLDDYLDGGLSAHDRTLVEAHLAVCQACLEEYRFESGLLQGLKVRLRVDEEAPPEGLLQKIRTLLSEEGPD